MPYSSDCGKQYIRNIVGRIKHDRMLDIGCGCGTYAKMFPEAKWTGIEIWEPYIDQFNLNDFYNEIILADARSIRLASLGRFDVAILGDVLEHMEKEDAINLIEQVKIIADTVIVSIPIGFCPQEEYEGNTYERHITDNWSDEQFRETFGEPTVGYVDEYIGVYCWSDKKIRPKICVYTISKNEEMFIERWANSAKDADILVIADTGSTDKTIEIAKSCGVQTHEICITPWRFDHARNANIALIPKDVDICICMDVDEVLEPGWRAEIEKVWTPDTTRLRYMFDWGAGIKFQYEKIHARHGYYWHHPCHEYPRTDGRIVEKFAYTNKLLVSHHPDPNKSRGQYLDLLELSVKEDPECPRNAFYYARELSFHSKWDEAIKECKRYLNLPGASWPNERCYAYRVMGKCYEGIGNQQEAEKSYYLACGEAPNTREPWCDLAMLMYRHSRWEECFSFSMRALKIIDREFVYTCDPAVWGHWAHDLASISAWNLGLKDKALEQAELAVKCSPNDERLRSNLKFIKNDVVKDAPNIIHMIYFQGPKSREFSYINYLAVRAANQIQKPDSLYLYYNEEPKDNPHWEAAKKYVTLVHMTPPQDYEGVSLHDWPQYQADVVRLQKLYDHGGIYLDTDAIITKPLNPFMKEDLTMCGHVAGISKSVEHKVDSIPVSTIIAKPKSEFIRIWLDQLAEGLKSNIWAWHAVDLPVKIYKAHSDLLSLQEMSTFLPFDFNNDQILTAIGEDAEKYANSISSSYVVHMWESVWIEKNKDITPEFVKSSKSAFAKIFKQYAD